MPSWQSYLLHPVIRLLAGRRIPQNFAHMGEDPNARKAALRYARRADMHTAPRRVAGAWSIQTITAAGAPLHLHTQANVRADRVLLYLHGGAYVHGPFGVQWALAASIAQRAGLDLAVLDYPRAPEHTADATRSAAFAAFELLSDSWGGPDRVAVLGDSAGGGLAVLLAQGLLHDGLAPPRCLALMSPWLDVGMSHPDIPTLASKDIQLDTAGLVRCAQLWACGQALDDPLLSPCFGPIEGLCPVWLSAGTHELFFPDCTAFASRLEAAGIEVELHVVEAMQHVFNLLPLPESKRTNWALVKFLLRH